MSKQDTFTEIWKKLIEAKAIDTLGYFADRWSDEKEYEDFEDYKVAVKKNLDKVLGVGEIKMSKRPFGVTFNHKGLEINIRFLKNGKVIGRFK